MPTCSRTLSAAFMLMASSVVAPLAMAASAPEEQRFSIQAFEISGNSLISPSAAQAIVQPFAGAERSFADIEQARLALQALYEQAGFGAVQVTVPEQEITRGVIQFKVIEAKLTSIDVQTTPYHDRENILAAMPQLREGRSPNTRALARSLALSNESTVKQTLVTLNTGSQPGEVAAKVTVRDASPWRGFVSLENNGSESAGGDWRVSAGLSHGNVFNRDHLWALQAITSAEKPKDVEILGGYWKIPLPALGDAIELSGSYANVSGNITAAGGSLAYQAAGYSAGARYVHNLEPVGDYKHNLSLGQDLRLVETEQKFTPDYLLTPMSLAYGGSRLTQESNTRIALSVVRNLGQGDRGSDANIAANGGRDKDYGLVRLNLSYNLFMKGGWDALFSMSGQWTGEPLPGAEDFGIGGAGSVRGFEEREFAGDKGARMGVEITTPGLKLSGGSVRLAGFVDYGQVWDDGVDPNIAIASAGVGVRLRVADAALLKVDAAYVLDGGGVHDRDPGRIHASLVWGF